MWGEVKKKEKVNRMIIWSLYGNYTLQAVDDDENDNGN